MIASPRGPRGSSEVTCVGMSWGRKAPWGVALCVMFVLATGCATKKPAPDQGVGGGIGEENIAPTQASLDRTREGLGPSEGGPLKDVHFDYDSDDINEAARAEIDDNLTWLRDNPKAKVELEGHCDNRGTIEYNLALGARRAKAVQDYMV